MSGTQSRPSDGRREALMVVGVLCVVVLVAIGTVWVRSDDPDAPTIAGAVTPAAARAETGTTAGTTTMAMPGATQGEATQGIRPRAAAPAPTGGGVHHADVYFDFRSTRLSAEAVRVLQETAALIAPGQAWTVLVQGHADRHGPGEYNRALALRRAENVKRFLVELGVPEASVKVVTLGQAGALCDDPAPECQRLNRRVHIEARRLPGTAALPVRPALVDGDTLDVGLTAVAPAGDGR